jgi:hypothetical protein
MLGKGTDLVSKDSFGRTLLLSTAENGNEMVVTLLLEKGVDFVS